ncbi:MAG: leucyl/phenylalanyl-tRNA--protein transferase [Gammaproteobacteria bacterium]|nr:leucyl/phenylalanyl-tRNA--protein transferase [Gammaproteobacteria bacterium]
MIRLKWLTEDPSSPFPSLDYALTDPNGLLAAGGDLSAERLLNAYSHGIFPWFNPEEPILWWSPDPRFVLFPEKLKISRSLRKTLNKNSFECRMDSQFAAVINACSMTRPDQQGTWISDEMKQAYIQLHQLGYAHSVESWYEGELVGGLYGVAVGQVFCGESMFSLKTDASKIALVHLCDYLQQRGFKLIDSQVYTSHLESLGAEMISRDDYLEILSEGLQQTVSPGKWSTG